MSVSCTMRVCQIEVNAVAVSALWDGFNLILLLFLRLCRQTKEQYIHGGEARDLKLEIPGTPPTVRICISLIFH